MAQRRVPLDTLLHMPHLKGFGTERARLGTFRGFGTERARLVTFRGFGKERARLGTFRGLVKFLPTHQYYRPLKNLPNHYYYRPQKIEEIVEKKVVRNFLTNFIFLIFLEFAQKMS